MKRVDEKYSGSKVEGLEDISPESLAEAREITMQMTPEDVDPNHMYQLCFKLLRLGSLEAEIPRLVVFGQQSMGKTTLLDFVMGGPIGYSSTDTGTKQPVVIMLAPSTTGSIECSVAGKAADIKEIQNIMRDVMQKISTVLSSELEVSISVPNGVHAVFVDLPGIKDDSKEGADLTRNVVKTYVSNNPNDLYILVKKASDDPANWPWSLREFILSPTPKGLGLTPKQTMCVGTRALDFLKNEKNDVKSQVELLERVQKRAVRDINGVPLPLFVLELFSLSLEDREGTEFSQRKALMIRQVEDGKKSCKDLLNNSFEQGSQKIRNEINNYFDAKLFKTELNHKFQNLLNQQLNVLERRLHRKKFDCNKTIIEVGRRMQIQNPKSLREAIKLFVRELVQVVTQLVTGNYVILRLPENGDDFLQQYGGNLNDNLENGHELALELFPDNYNDYFLNHIKEQTENIFQRLLEQSKINKEEENEDSINLDSTLGPFLKPHPNPKDKLIPGQYVRYLVVKESSNMFGFITSIQPVSSGTTGSTEPKPAPPVEEKKNPELGKHAKDIIRTSPSSSEHPTASSTTTIPTTPTTTTTSRINVGFYYQTNSSTEPTYQQRAADPSRITVILPLALLASPKNVPPQNYRCWKRVIRKDTWLAVEGVVIKSVKVEPQLQTTPIPNDPAKRMEMVGNIMVTVATTLSKTLHGPPDDSTTAEVPLSLLFVDASALKNDPLPMEEGEEPKFVTTWEYLTTMQKIAGDFAETKTLNQLSLTHLGRWLKFHITNLEPDRKFSNDVLLQLMRSVPQVIDKADWEPLVADLLQANVKGGLLPLSKLASCATGTALRRIFKAAIHETKRQIMNGDLTSGLIFLASNQRFMEEVDEALEDFCRVQATQCANAMRDAIFEQTKAIHFEMIQDFFDGCRQFETDFMGTERLKEVTKDVRHLLYNRKQHLGVADIYARQLSSGISESLIYDEVRIQFWAVKMMLAPPLTTKLYKYFVQQIKDNKEHLATEAKYNTTSESIIERTLQQRLLCEARESDMDTPSTYIPRSDEDIIKYYEFDFTQDDLRKTIEQTKRIDEYIKLVAEGVYRLRLQIQKKGGVDFLTRLDLGSPSPVLQTSDLDSPSTVLQTSDLGGPSTVLQTSDLGGPSTVLQTSLPKSIPSSPAETHRTTKTAAPLPVIENKIVPTSTTQQTFPFHQPVPSQQTVTTIPFPPSTGNVISGLSRPPPLLGPQSKKPANK